MSALRVASLSLSTDKGEAGHVRLRHRLPSQRRDGPDITKYLRLIDATLEPFEGRFLVHGAGPEVVEGSLEGDIVIIEFPSLDSARGWYHSDGYQEIAPFRVENSTSTVVFIDGVPAGHRATDVLGGVAAGS